MLLVSLNKYSYKRAFFIFFFLLSGFLTSGTVLAQVIYREPPDVTKINVPAGTVASGSCPDDLDPSLFTDHVSICGIVKTADISVKDGVEYAQQPIKGATVAAYLGVRYLSSYPGLEGYAGLFRDPNNTGEIVGLIERLYTYDITNKDGRFILPVPRGAGTAGFAFLGVFCGDQLKDLYMISTVQGLPYMPVSLACPPEVTPAKKPDTNNIPAPPSINYANRKYYTSCEDSFGMGDPGIKEESTRTVSNPLFVGGLDNTRSGARVLQDIEYYCELIPLSNPPEYNVRNLKPVGTPTFLEDPIPGGFILEVPEQAEILSRRDLEGFIHTSMGYSFQTISSLNCGVAGCYNTNAPSMGHETIKYLNQEMVKICNTEPFPPLNCKGPGIELAEPGEWTSSYNLQKTKEVYDGIELGDITLPQYSSTGQLIQEILNVYGIILNVGPGDTIDTIIGKLGKMLLDIGDDLAMKDFLNLIVEFNEFKDAFGAFYEHPSIGTAITLVQTYSQFVVEFYTDVLKIAGVIGGVLIPQDVKDAYDAVKEHALGIRDAVVKLFQSLPIITQNEVDEFTNEVKTHIDGIVASLAKIGAKFGELVDLARRIRLAIQALQDIRITTVNSDLFPYSTVLNYDIQQRFRALYLNRPANDSYANFLGENRCQAAEDDRRYPSKYDVADFPFNACYGAFLLGEDTYSTQKALYTTTKNTDRKVADMDLAKTKPDRPNPIIDPVVSKFLAPNEPVGVEVANPHPLEVESVADIPKVGGRGYWRLGTVQTMCSHGVEDFDSYVDPVNNKKQYVDFPVLAVYGEEGAMRALPQYSQ
jgi:hypothetical protein